MSFRKPATQSQASLAIMRPSIQCPRAAVSECAIVGRERQAESYKPWQGLDQPANVLQWRMHETPLHQVCRESLFDVEMQYLERSLVLRKHSCIWQGCLLSWTYKVV